MGNSSFVSKLLCPKQIFPSDRYLQTGSSFFLQNHLFFAYLYPSLLVQLSQIKLTSILWKNNIATEKLLFRFNNTTKWNKYELQNLSAFLNPLCFFDENYIFQNPFKNIKAFPCLFNSLFCWFQSCDFFGALGRVTTVC